jgi:predicted  nucleic acid-binding Zn-ribbon protein
MEDMAKQQSRTQRWYAAVNSGKQALEALQELKDEAGDDLMELQQRFVDELQEELDKITNKLSEKADTLRAAFEDLESLRQEYEEWYDNMPQQLQDGPTGEKLSELVNQFDFDVEVNVELEVPDIDFPELDLDLDEYESTLEEADAADLPRGFGRD